MYDNNKIMKEVKALKMPKRYFQIDLDKLFSNDYYMILSIRKDAGKTTQALLLGLILFKLYGKITEYIRSDTAQITRKNITTLFDVIRKFGYIEKLFDGEYNDIMYKSQIKKFFLVLRDADGNVIKTCDRVLCAVHSLEEAEDMKSSYNSPDSDYMIFDEFLDTKRSSVTQMTELQHQVSTIGRGREDFHCVMLGNNTSPYSFWWDEFTLNDMIPDLNYGNYIEFRTRLGTTMYIKLWEVSEEAKDIISKAKVRFSGFDTPKMNIFNGLGAWSGQVHPHIPSEEMLDAQYLVYNRVYIKHRGRYVQLVTYCNNIGPYVYLHFANKPKMDDNIILCEYPEEVNEIYGVGNYLPEKAKKRLFKIINLRNQHKWYYSSNKVGDLMDDYFKSIR